MPKNEPPSTPTGSLGSTPIQQHPPAPNDAEVTIIGPNVGECVILHYDGNWLIVDSCLERSTKFPAALHYLNSIGVDLDAVKLVACSHWHDDHIKGLSILAEKCQNAKFWMSSALRCNEFLQLVEAYRISGQAAGPITTGIDELTRCLDTLRARNQAPQFATHDQRLWMTPDCSSELWALSPSSTMVLHAFQDIASMMPTAWSRKSNVPIRSPNHIAVAMHFRAGAHSVILGSDLETQSDPNTGWNAVITSESRPKTLASLYKVAHHGSETAEHHGIWENLLIPSPVSTLTPFTRSRLPRDADLTRIAERSSRAFLSARGHPSKVDRRGSLGKMVKKYNLTAVGASFGIIQCRIDASNSNASWRIGLGGDASGF